MLSRQTVAVLVAAAGLALLVVPAQAQLPSLQGVQPIFNNQLGAWSATQPSAAGGPNNSQIPQRHYTVRVPRGAWWWAGRYPYGVYYPQYPYSNVYGRRYGYTVESWNNYPTVIAPTVVAPPVIVVQPQIVIPAAAGATTSGSSVMPSGQVSNRSLGNQLSDQQEIVQRVARLKPSTEAGRMRADQLLSDGDREFAAGQYRRAAAKYREAIQRAPDYAKSYFRAGHAGVAAGDYDLAVTYFGMALELVRNIDRGGFHLDELYRGNDQAKAEHLRALDLAAARQPLAGGLPFLTGITQHYDGHTLPAREQFRRAADLAGRHQPYTGYFLP